MMRRAAALLLVTIVAILGPAIRAGADPLLPGLKNGDERVASTSKDWPFSAIGRLNSRAGGFCTGTLVGSHLVLTASHCLFNLKTRRWLPPESFHFAAGFDRGSMAADGAVSGIWRGSRDIPPERASDGQLAADWAYVSLDGAFAQGPALAPLPLYEGSPHDLVGRTVELAAYHQDRPFQLSRQQDCRILYASAGMFRHSCGVTKGSSGAPILARTEDGWELVGISIGYARTQDGPIGIGVLPPPPPSLP